MYKAHLHISLTDSYGNIIAVKWQKNSKIVLTYFCFTILPQLSASSTLMLKTLKSSKPADLKNNLPKLGHLHPVLVHTGVKGRLMEVLECNTDGKRGGKKLRVIVPAQCTQLSIVQVLRALAITAQLMPVAWLRFQLRITTPGPEQGGEKRKRADNWIPAVSARWTGRWKEERRRKAEKRWHSIYLCHQPTTPI